MFFPFADYWPFYLCFAAFILLILLLDLGVFHKKAHVISVREAGIWTCVWISLALVFNFAFYKYMIWKFTTDPYYLTLPGFDPAATAWQLAMEFLTGFVVEKALAVDNIFVFAVIFTYFSIPAKYQHRILFFGILGAFVFRAIFIALGSILMQYHLVVILFGVFLILTGVKMFFAGDEKIEPEKNIVIRGLRKVFRIHPHIEGDHFFIRKDGLLYATPLFVVLIFLEFSDIIFAVDSVPAIFAITKEPLIVFTSNIFAILGLRAMYFMLSGVMDRFIYIKYGLASVLIFVGLKMTVLNTWFDGKFPILWSLGIILFLISSSVVVSLVVDRQRRKQL